jgi:hypothetical protein
VCLKAFLQRLAELQQFHAEGIISTTEYTRYKAHAIEDAPSPKKSGRPLPLTSSATPMTPVELGALGTRKTCPVTSKKPATTKARETRRVARCGDMVSQSFAENSPFRDDYLSTYMSTKEGKREFPMTNASLQSDSHLMGLLHNVQNTIQTVGKHAGRFLIRLLTGGLPTEFLKTKLNMTDKECAMRREGVKKPEPIEKSDLIQQKYAANVNRTKVTSTESGLYEQFFKTSSAVFSGTERRCVELTKHDWKCQVAQTPRDYNHTRSRSTLDHTPCNVNPRNTMGVCSFTPNGPRYYVPSAKSNRNS